jgi:hypothetical protein
MEQGDGTCLFKSHGTPLLLSIPIMRDVISLRIPPATTVRIPLGWYGVSVQHAFANRWELRTTGTVDFCALIYLTYVM